MYQKLSNSKFSMCVSVLVVPSLAAAMHGCLLSGSREQAFVYALSSAAVLQTVAKRCSAGAASKCGCGRSPATASGRLERRFQWGGCADNVEFGAEFSTAFCDARWRAASRRRSRNRRAATNLHNNHAGRVVRTRIYLHLFARE